MKTLERRLGLWPVVIISISAMLGSGVFVLPGLAVGMTGGSAWLAYLTVALCILPAALAKAELASALPQSGGAYVFINQAFGPLTGTIMGLGLWASLLLKSAFALIGFGAYLRVLDETSSTQTLALGLLVLITGLNLAGIKKVSQFQTVVVIIALSGLALLIGTGLPMVNTANLRPLFRNGALGFSETVAFIFISYAGVTKVAAIAGEVKAPGKNLPLAIIISLALITPIYCLVVFVLNGVLPIASLEHNIHPIYSLADAVLGPIGGFFAAIIAILTMTSMANAGLLAASRFPFAMSRDGLVPPLFGVIHQRYLTPTYCILLTAGVMAAAISSLEIERIAKLASACMILAFGFNNIALIILRESKAQWYKPTYSAPLYPGLPIAGVILSLLLLITMGKMALYAIVGISVAGCVLFLLYGRKRHTGAGVLGKLGLRADLLATYEPENHDVSQMLSPEATTVVALIGRERKSVEMLTQMGAALGARKGADIVHITEVPDQMALDELLEEEPWVNALRRRVLGMREMAKINVKFGTMVSHDVVGTVHYLSSRMRCEWLVMSWRPYRFFNPLGWLYNNLPNDLAIFKDASIRYIRRILILVEPGPQDLIVAEAAHNLARYYRASITFVRFIPVDTSEVDTQHARGHLQYIQSICDSHSKTLLLRGHSKMDTLIRATEAYDLFVVGSRPHYRWRNIFFKTAEETLIDRALCSALLLKSPRMERRDTQPQETFDLSEHVSVSLVRLGDQVSTKEELFKLCAEHFTQELPDEFSQDAIVTALQSREKSQNTGVCHGVGMPHAVLEELEETYLLLEVLKEPFDYDAPDGKPVDVIFSTIGPPHQRQLQLMLLATLSKQILDTSLLSDLREADTTDELMWLLHSSLKIDSPPEE